MRPRIEWLETFIAIVETGSLTKAAERIARSQSAVSLQLHQLEDTVGARLFGRRGRGMAPTPAGEKLLPIARRAVSAVREAGAVALDAGQRIVRAGVPEEYADHLVPGLLADLAERDPALTVEVECTSSPILERRVRSGHLDLAFVLAEEIEGAGEPVAVDPVVWLQKAGSRLSRHRPLPVALFEQACGWRNRAIESLDRSGIDFEIVLTSASVGGIRAGLRAGFAVGVLAASTAGTGLERISGRGAPPSLSDAELVLLRGTSQAEDAELLVSGARQQLLHH